jgi:hypothetical protein
MKKEELYSHFKALALSHPDLNRYLQNRVECDQWLARAFALVQLEGDVVRIVEFQRIIRHFNGVSQSPYKSTDEIQTVASILMQCTAKLDLLVAPDIQGSFVHVGQSLDAYKALNQIFALAKKSLLIVDPYMDGTIITEYMIGVSESVEISLLADNASFKSDLIVAGKKWRTQYTGNRSLEIRLAADRTLHDRIIIADGIVVWMVTQSFKDFAKRSPASVLRVDADTAALKVQAYEPIWKQAVSVM